MRTTKINKIAKILAETSDKSDMKLLLNCLFTDKELLDVANRLKIFELLANGVPHRAIAEQLGVGIATVTRGAREFKSKNYQVLEKHLNSAFK